LAVPRKLHAPEESTIEVNIQFDCIYIAHLGPCVLGVVRFLDRAPGAPSASMEDFSMTNPPSPLAAPLAWDLVAAGYAAESLAQFSKYAADALSMADVEKDEHVLDVAAGPGSLALQAALRAREVAAIDFAPEMLNELRMRMAERGLTNIRVRHGDGQALPYDDESFDAAFSMFGLIFFPDRRRGFSELFRVIRPGGRAVVASWQPMSRIPILVAVFEALAAELPDLPFGDGKGPLSNPDDLRREMEAAGFQVTIEERTHVAESSDITAFWASLRRSFAPLVLLENRMGERAFAPVADGIERRLRERASGTIRMAMPAWLALGRRPAR
jgi:SAM-dependent methyltransferase